MNRRWICNDVLMDILPSFDRPQLGLKMALLSPRFDALVDKHFDGKSEFPILRTIKIYKDPVVAVPKLAVVIDEDNSVAFPLPDHSLPNKIRFKNLWIEYIDHSVIAFLRANQQIFHKWNDTKLTLRFFFAHNSIGDQPIWDVFVRELWPVFAQNIRHFLFPNGDYLDNLRRRISPTILTDANINSIHSGAFPDSIADDVPNATAGQALSKWLHTPSKNGQPKRFYCMFASAGDVNKFKEKFRNATTSAHYKIQFSVYPKPIEPFELVNGRTNEKLILIKPSEDEWDGRWIMERCQNGETETAIQWEYGNSSNLNNVSINLFDVICIGPFSPPEQQQ